jgi:release factor glutamine methyltransferase
VATDVSEEALEVARANLATAAPGAAVEMRHGAGYAPVRGERFDVIVSNPPYIGLLERVTLEPEVREWEPESALFAGDDGLNVVRDLVSGAADHLQPGGLLALEIGASQAEAVTALIRATGRFGAPRVRKDLSDRQRMVLAELEGGSTA